MNQDLLCRIGRRSAGAALGVAMLLVSSAPGSATTWHVDPSGTGDAATIQAAFDLASPGDLILLAPGTYTDSNSRGTSLGTTDAVAHMSPGVSLESSGGAAVTTIDGTGARHGLFAGTVGSVGIRGITFRNCRSNGSGSAEKWGGGILATESTVAIEGCRFIECSAPSVIGGGGGGIFLNGCTNSWIRSNLFLRCTATDIGGGVEVYLCTATTVENNTFAQNFASRGGGAILMNLSSTALDNNIFASNGAGLTAGAVYCLNSHAETAACNVFWQNTSPGAPDVAACSVLIGVSDNVIGDPQFCDAATDDFTLRSTSIAAPTNPSGCGLRGAFPVACGPVSVEPNSWGKVKAAYR